MPKPRTTARALRSSFSTSVAPRTRSTPAAPHSAWSAGAASLLGFPWMRAVVHPDPGLRSGAGRRVRGRAVRVVAGDRVRVEVSAYDLSRGRITFRHRN